MYMYLVHFLFLVDKEVQFDGLGANQMVLPSLSGSLIGMITHGQSQGCR